MTTKMIDFFAMTINQLSSAASCFSFTDAACALKTLLRGDIIPDIIFLDLNMPIMDGQEFLLMRKGNELLMDIAVIIPSTSSHPYTIEKVKLTEPLNF